MKAILRSINNFSCKLKQSNNLKYNISPKIRSNKVKNISGNGNIVIEDALNKYLKDYKVYGNTVQSKLPSGYTQVEYVKSDDYSWIDMGLKGNQNIKITTSISFESGGTFLGDITNSSKAISLRFFRNNSGSISRFGNKSVEGVFTNYNYNTKYLIEINSDGILVDNELIHEWGDVGTFETTTNLYLFKNSTASTAPRSYIYYCKVYDGNTLVRDYIPCYRNSDNEVGLYDLVNKVFYTNQGTGAFTYGSVVPTSDAPIEMVSCGDRTKNLFDKNNANNLLNNVSINNSTSVISNANGFYTLRTDCKPNTTYAISKVVSSRFIVAYSNNLTYTSGETLLGKVSNNSATNLTITTGENAKTLYVFYSHLSDETTYTLQQILDSIQIEENSTATSYEPYGYKIPVNVRSENLLNPLLKENGDRGIIATYNQQNDKIIFSGTATTTYSNIGETIILDEKLPIGTYYLITPNTHSNFRIGVHLIYTDDTYSNFIIYENTKYNSITTSKEIKSYYLYLSSLTKNTTYNEEFKIMLAKSDNVIPYQPYYNETTNIYLDEPLRKIDGYSDYIDFINGKVIRNIDEIVLDGSESWADATITSNVLTHRFRNIGALSHMVDIGFSDKFIVKDSEMSVYDDIEMVQLSSSQSNKYIGVKIYKDRLTTDNASGLKNWLSSNPITIDYVLLTQTEEDIELPNIKLIEGKNIITIGTEVQGVFEVEYYSKEIIDISNYKYNLRKVED